MKIGILSDTHITELADDWLALGRNAFHEVEVIIHTGDFVSFETYEFMKSYKKLYSVWGNCDEIRIRRATREKQVITLSGYRIGIFHGHGHDKTTLERAYDQFADDNVDLIIFGHSHQPLVQTKRGILMINPGSMTNKRREKWLSYIIMELLPGRIQVGLNYF